MSRVTKVQGPGSRKVWESRSHGKFGVEDSAECGVKENEWESGRTGERGNGPGATDDLFASAQRMAIFLSFSFLQSCAILSEVNMGRRRRARPSNMVMGRVEHRPYCSA